MFLNLDHQNSQLMAKTKNAKPKMSTFYIPTELKEKILSKLPLKSLKRVLTLNKECYNLITKTPQFLSAHLKFTNSLDVKTIFLLEFGVLTGIIQREMSCVLYSEDDKVFNEYAMPKAPITSSIYTLRVYGSCNGLICLSDCKELVVLWNPSIQRAVSLPVSDGISHVMKRFPFGCVFDNVSNDFKVLRINYFGGGEVVVQICRLRTNLWECWTKEIPFIDIQGDQVDLKGVAHWLGVDSQGKAMIVSFDVHKEVFASIKMPATLAELEGNFWRKGYPGCLFLFEGSLVLIYYANENHGNIRKSRTRYDFWKMEEYGKAESWNLWHSLYCYETRRALGFRKNGEFLWVHDKHKEFISTNLENFSETCFGRYETGHVGKCLNYVESLALLDSTKTYRWDEGMEIEEESESPSP